MLVFIKLGGSLITDKHAASTFRADTMARLAREIKLALDSDGQMRLLIGHGSGSFGHFAASEHGTAEGVASPEEWRGFAHVADAAATLSYLVTRELRGAGVPVWRLQPSASAVCRGGELVQLALDPIRAALQNGLVPLIHGDVAIDEVRGGTIISTEVIFQFLARNLPVSRIILFGDVPGVYDEMGAVIPRITPMSYSRIEHAIGGSAAVDVTGGMLAKVRDMLNLVRGSSQLTVRILSGLRPGLLTDALLDRTDSGTLLAAD